MNWHGVARYLLCREIAEAGYKVALTGEGGDELFAGYVQFRQDLIFDRSIPIPVDLAPVQSRLGFVPAWFKKLAINRSIFHVLLNREFSAMFSGRNPYCEFLSQFDIEGRLKGRHRMHQSMYLWIRSILPNYTLYAERLEMAHAVEARVPLLDHFLFESVCSVPAPALVRDGQEKYLLRAAARPVLTDTVFRRAKHPFFAPPAGSGSNPLQTLVQDTLRGNALRSIPFFDPDMIVTLLDRFPTLDESTRTTLDSTFLMALSAAVLQDKYRIGST